MTKMTTKKKMKKGYMKKRTMEDVTNEYGAECSLYGHKTCLLKIRQQQCESLKKELEEHEKRIMNLNNEAGIKQKEKEAEEVKEKVEAGVENVATA
jgi:uncharacterized GH25 family protein